jgi:hypothetical protein
VTAAACDQKSTSVTWPYDGADWWAGSIEHQHDRPNVTPEPTPTTALVDAMQRYRRAAQEGQAGRKELRSGICGMPVRLADKNDGTFAGVQLDTVPAPHGRGAH